MPFKLDRIFNIQRNEIAVFLWSAGLLFLIRVADILFNNFGETMFLKRFGVEYLPLVYVANAIVTFFLMGFMTGIMRRISSARLLAWLLVFCGVTVASLRLVVTLDVPLLYPALFLLKSQYEALLSLVFWNLANDLFDTRQSKRIFPLIAAGGVVGAILGSFGTPPLALTITLNNLMLVYLVVALLAAATVWRMDALFPTMAAVEKPSRKGQSKPKTNFIDEIKQVFPLLKSSVLIKILVLLTFLPNVVIPIMNYQFNYAVNDAFVTEGGMIEFFGYFRGGLNIVSLIILMFVGKLYGRFGLPVALMFHPINYVIAFTSFLLRFDVFSAMFARLSTNVLRVTINNPARDVLMGLFPAEYRPLLRPFLRGTVVRVGILLGSGSIMLAEGLVHPRWLSIIGVVVCLAWAATSFWLKRVYSQVLLDLISDNVVDLKSLEESEIGRIFTDKKAQERLVKACYDSDAPVCVWYAEMMKAQKVPGLEDHLLGIIQAKDEAAVVDILPLVPAQAGAKAVAVYRGLAEHGSPRLNQALAQAAGRLDPAEAMPFLKWLLDKSEDKQVAARAVAGLYRGDPQKYRPLVRRWLESPSPAEREAGVTAAGGSGDQSYLPELNHMLAETGDWALEHAILIALDQLGCPELRKTVLTRLKNDPDSVPLEVLDHLAISDEETARAFVQLLGQESDELRNLALRKLEEAPHHDAQVLIQSLALPGRLMREGVFTLMESLKISDREVLGFVRSELERAYRNLAESASLGIVPDDALRDLLRDHLEEKSGLRLETILRVVASQGDPSQMRILMRGLESTDSRLRSNAIEALESLVGHELSQGMLPLLETGQRSTKLAAGKKLFKLAVRPKDESELFGRLLVKRDETTLLLALGLAVRRDQAANHPEQVAVLTQAQNPLLRALAAELLQPAARQPAKETPAMAAVSDFSEKILLLRRMDLFKGLRVNELAAIAGATEDSLAAGEEDVVREGEPGDTMYLIVKGKLNVTKAGDDGCSLTLAELTEGDYFGEMALFEDGLVRSATVTATSETQLLVLDKPSFREIVREYPQVALQICKELSARLRSMHLKIQSLPFCDLEPPRT